MNEPLDVLDRLAQRAAERPVPRSRDDDAVLREAIVVGRARARVRARRSAITVAAGGLLAAAAVWALYPSRPSGASLPSAPAELLVTHHLGAHSVVSSGGTGLEVDTLDEDVALRLAEGAALFDVAPLAPGHAFVVTTPDARVRVVGTVFAVTVRAGRTRVEVFEGEVVVEREGDSARLRAGEVSGPDLSGPSEDLRERGARAALERSLRAPASPADEGSAAIVDREAGEVAPSAEAPSVGEGPLRTGGPEARIPRGGEAEPGAIDLATLRALCDRGAFFEALAAMDGVTPPVGERAEWAMLEGDAARATGDLFRAASAYERSASLATPSRAALAGFLAATSYQRAGDPEAALRVLHATSAAERGSPLEERALALEATLLARLGRSDEAAERARRYLAGFPGGAARAEMESLTD